MTKVALISANLGNHCSDRIYAEQLMLPGYSINIFRYNDNNFPPRASMTPRAQAKIPKMLGWQLNPGYDYYIWVDASFSIPMDNSAQWIVDQCADYHACFFRHPQRTKVIEEKEFLESEIKKGNEYISGRYSNETYNNAWFSENLDLYACGVFVYTKHMFEPLREWFYQNMRYNINDQLSLPYILSSYECNFNVLNDNILHNGRFRHHNEKLVVL